MRDGTAPAALPRHAGRRAPLHARGRAVAHRAAGAVAADPAAGGRARDRARRPHDAACRAHAGGRAARGAGAARARGARRRDRRAVRAVGHPHGPRGDRRHALDRPVRPVRSARGVPRPSPRRRARRARGAQRGDAPASARRRARRLVPRRQPARRRARHPAAPAAVGAARRAARARAPARAAPAARHGRAARRALRRVRRGRVAAPDRRPGRARGRLRAAAGVRVDRAAADPGDGVARPRRGVAARLGGGARRAAGRRGAGAQAGARTRRHARVARQPPPFAGGARVPRARRHRGCERHAARISLGSVITATGLHDAIAELAQFNDDPSAGGITREVYTPTYRAALERVADWMRAAGLEVRLDAVGNLFGGWEGAEPEAPLVLSGSHVDTTLNAGRYDGVLGVLGAIAAVQSLRSAGSAPRRSIEVVAWAGEEPRFGTGCVGSRAAAGRLARADLDRLRDRDGVSMAAALRAAGFDPGRVQDARIDPAGVHALVELHIEQGIVLEQGGESIGVVEAIAAPHDFRMTLRGAATHAGATPMRLRRDALAGAAEAMTALERIARESPSGTTVGTVGVLRVRPGAINVVPGEAELDVDVRDSDLGAREQTVAEAVAAAGAIAERRGLELERAEIVADVPVACDPDVIDAAARAAEALGLPYRRMTSGAYHDAMIMGARVPIGMIFVPSRGGVSHHPDEFTAPEELERGVQVLAATLARLAA